MPFFLVLVVLQVPTHSSLHRPLLQPIPWWYPTRLGACTFLHTLLSTVPSYNPSHDGILSLCLYIPTHSSLHRPVLQPIPWWYPVSVLVHSYTHFSPPSRLTTHPMMVSYLSLCLYIPTHSSLHRPVLQPIPWWYPVSVLVHSCTLFSSSLALYLSLYLYCAFLPTSLRPHLPTHPMRVPCLNSLHVSVFVHSYPLLSVPTFPPIPWGYLALILYTCLCVCTFLPTSLRPHLPTHPMRVPCLLYTCLCACTVHFYPLLSIPGFPSIPRVYVPCLLNTCLCVLHLLPYFHFQTPCT